MNEWIRPEGEGAEEKEEKKEEGFIKEFLKTRAVMVCQPIDDEIARKATQQILVLESKDPEAPITVYVNSPGGSADSGFALYDLLRFVTCPVRTVVNGLCASAAVLVYLGGRKGLRFSLPNSRFLLHQPRTHMTGHAADIQISAREILRLKNRYNEIVASETGKDAKKVAEDADRDFWLSATEAREYGLIDRIVTAKSEIESAK